MQCWGKHCITMKISFGISPSAVIIIDAECVNRVKKQGKSADKILNKKSRFLFAFTIP